MQEFLRSIVRMFFDNVGGKVNGSLPVGSQSQNSEVDEKEV